MGLSVGIVGLPNVGKSTTFNALTKTQDAQSANYPFCTIEPNKAVVPLKDKRIDALCEIVSPQNTQYATVEFVDIAGLVKGASKGEGLGNQFLSNIREVEVILHMVRCFENDDITHVEDGIDPLRDVEIIETELIFADLQSIDRKIEKLSKQAKADKAAKAMLEVATDLKTHLDELKPVSAYPKKSNNDFVALNKELRFLSGKTVIYVGNVGEDELDNDNAHVVNLKAYAKTKNAQVVKICAAVEEELIGLEEEEAKAFLQELGADESGLDMITRLSFDALNLMTYFTAGKKEVRAWVIPKDTFAPRAAAAIHNDFEKGFIKADVISYQDYIDAGSESKAKEMGKLRLEGKEYIVQDGDIMHFKFNV